MLVDTPFTIIFGPTATGKSQHAYTLADAQNTDVLSFDSRHVYQEMDIVTGKDRPPAHWEHQLLGIDLVKPDQDFSIRHYYEYAAPLIDEYRRKHQPLILVGGSWQYVDVLLHPPASLFVPQDETWRDKAAELSVAQLQAELQRLNTQKWREMTPSDQANPRRLIRAVEVARHQEIQPPEPLLKQNEYHLEFHQAPLEEIEIKIKQRIESRLEQGALEETRQLIQKYPVWDTPAWSATGYRPLRVWLEKTIDEVGMKSRWFHQEREYAKRQLTWMKSLLQE